VLPNTEDYWIKEYGQVALSGKEMYYENFSSELNKYYQVYEYSPEYKKKCIESGMDDYTSKPFNLEELNKVIIKYIL